MASLSSWAGFSFTGRGEGATSRQESKEERLKGFCYKHAQVLEVSNQQDIREVEFQIHDGRVLILQFKQDEEAYRLWLALRRYDYFLIPVEDSPEKTANVKMSLRDIELLNEEVR